MERQTKPEGGVQYYLPSFKCSQHKHHIHDSKYYKEEIANSMGGNSIVVASITITG